jgi:hypothetical protein
MPVPTPQFDAASAFSDEVVVDGKRIRVVDGECVLEVDEPHIGDPEGVIGAGYIDAGLAVDVGGIPEPSGVKCRPSMQKLENSTELPKFQPVQQACRGDVGRRTARSGQSPVLPLWSASPFTYAAVQGKPGPPSSKERNTRTHASTWWEAKDLTESAASWAASQSQTPWRTTPPATSASHTYDND